MKKSSKPKKEVRVLNEIDEGRIPDGYKKDEPKRESAKGHKSKYF